MEMSEKIKYLRGKLNLTLEEVGNAVGVGKSTVRKWENGDIANMRRDKIAALAKVLQTTPAYLMDWEELAPAHPANAIPIPQMRRIPVLGSIRAGSPVFADENIESYEYTDAPDDQDCYFLRVKGDSMINARIYDGDLVLIKQQQCADDGQIVACLVNGDEATLKRFYRQKDMVILKPENPAYSPIIVPCSDFESGYAQILGVVIEVKFKP